MKPLFLLILVTTICGCSHSKPRRVTYRDVGHLIRVDRVPHGWLEDETSKVVTDKGTFIVKNTVSVIVPGDPVRVSNKGVLYIGATDQYFLYP